VILRKNTKKLLELPLFEQDSSRTPLTYTTLHYTTLHYTDNCRYTRLLLVPDTSNLYFTTNDIHNRRNTNVKGRYKVAPGQNMKEYGRSSSITSLIIKLDIIWSLVVKITPRFYYGKDSGTSLKFDAEYSPWAAWAFGKREKNIGPSRVRTLYVQPLE
jgi:hypothetical protein